jgi:hypothetical protein
MARRVFSWDFSTRHGGESREVSGRLRRLMVSAHERPRGGQATAKSLVLFFRKAPFSTLWESSEKGRRCGAPHQCRGLGFQKRLELSLVLLEKSTGGPRSTTGTRPTVPFSTPSETLEPFDHGLNTRRRSPTASCREKEYPLLSLPFASRPWILPTDTTGNLVSCFDSAITCVRQVKICSACPRCCWPSHLVNTLAARVKGGVHADQHARGRCCAPCQVAKYTGSGRR